jgi:glutathionylspermidine synthase
MTCRAGECLTPEEFSRLRRRAIFECCKWDVQFEDVSTLAPYPLLIQPRVWCELANTAELLAAEVLEAEAELLQRPDLLPKLALPRAVVTALRTAIDVGPSTGIARLMRFDFHVTTEGWRITEANTDVPGGLNEASGFTTLVGCHYPDTRMPGDPARAYVEALAAGLPPGARVALVHATAYSDDHQMMRYIGERLRDGGLKPALVSPAHLKWPSGTAQLMTDWASDAVDAVVRFFPAEWLPNLGATAEWRRFFVGGRTPASNPAGALVTQSKRFPLLWDDLRAPLPTWRSVLPETRDPRDVAWRSQDEWVMKPALGRVGEGIAVPGTTSVKDWTQIRRDVFWHPGAWIAQRRFDAIPIMTAAGERFPCIGVYTVDGRAAGAYGRLATRPLIDSKAQDVAVLVENSE